MRPLQTRGCRHVVVVRRMMMTTMTGAVTWGLEMERGALEAALGLGRGQVLLVPAPHRWTPWSSLPPTWKVLWRLRGDWRDRRRHPLR